MPTNKRADVLIYASKLIFLKYIYICQWLQYEYSVHYSVYDHGIKHREKASLVQLKFQMFSCIQEKRIWNQLTWQSRIEHHVVPRDHIRYAQATTVTISTNNDVTKMSQTLFKLTLLSAPGRVSFPWFVGLNSPARNKCTIYSLYHLCTTPIKHSKWKLDFCTFLMYPK